MDKLLRSGDNFNVFFNYNFPQWGFVCDFQCSSVDLLLSDDGGAWFTEFTFNVFDPSS